MIAAAAAIARARGRGDLARDEDRQSGKATAPTFRRLTFRTGLLNNARFAPDGQTVVYGATWAGERQALYAVRPESPESRAFDVSADILAISPAGEMAVLLGNTGYAGTLARMPFAGGVPRPAVDNVVYAGADWSPDGKDLAIIRRVGGKFRLEFPIGKVLYEGATTGGARFSPRGDLIVFQDDPGAIKVVPSGGGAVRTLSTGWVPFGGGAPCWTPDGKEIWFSAAAEPGAPEALHAVDLDGKVRLVAQVPGFLELDDISRDGRALFAHHTIVDQMWGLAPGETEERDLSWLDRSTPAALSADGKTILFSETGEAGGNTSSVYVRRMDGSPAVRLGEGEGIALSPDGAWVLVSHANDPRRMTLLPAGVGETKSLSVSGFEAISGGAFHPDGTSVIFAGRERGRGSGLYSLPISGGSVRRSLRKE